jgi:uncharacterized protein YndB with AHSA1/START domain
MVATTTVERECTLLRILEAPRERAFQAWTDLRRLRRWFFNRAQEIPSDPMTVNLRVGGG